jgi:hypothetical protein
VQTVQCSTGVVHFRVCTKHNPADPATHLVSSSKLQDSMWLYGPNFLQIGEEYIQCTTVFPLIDPDNDMEIRSEVVVQKTHLDENDERTSLVYTFTKFGRWLSLVRTIARLNCI